MAVILDRMVVWVRCVVVVNACCCLAGVSSRCCGVSCLATVDSRCCLQSVVAVAAMEAVSMTPRQQSQGHVTVSNATTAACVALLMAPPRVRVRSTVLMTRAVSCVALTVTRTAPSVSCAPLHVASIVTLTLLTLVHAQVQPVICLCSLVHCLLTYICRSVVIYCSELLFNCTYWLSYFCMLIYCLHLLFHFLSCVKHNQMERFYYYCQRFFVVDGPRDEVAKSTRFPPVPTQHPSPHYGTSFSS